MEQFLLQVWGWDSYAWLVFLLLAFVMLQALIIVWVVKAYRQAKDRLHNVTTDSIMAYTKISEAMNFIRTDLQNFTMISSKGNDTIAKSLESRLDRIDRMLDELRRDVFRK